MELDIFMPFLLFKEICNEILEILLKISGKDLESKGKIQFFSLALILF